MRVLIDSGKFAPSNGNGYVDYTPYVLDGSLVIEDSVNVPTLIQFDLAATDDGFVLPARSSYVRIESELFNHPYVSPFILADTPLAIANGIEDTGTFLYGSGSGSSSPAKPEMVSDADGNIFLINSITTTSVQLQQVSIPGGVIPPGCDSGGFNTIFSYASVQTFELFPYIGFASVACIGYCSFDNTLIMACQGQTTLAKWDIKTQKVIATLHVPNALFDQAAFKNISNDGVMAVRATDSFTLIDVINMRVNYTIGNIHTLTSPGGYSIGSSLTGATAYAPPFIPGQSGRAIFAGALTGGSPSNMVVFDFHTNKLSDVTGINNANTVSVRVSFDSTCFYAISLTDFTVQRISLKTYASIATSAPYNNAALEGTTYSIYSNSHIEPDPFGNVYLSLICTQIFDSEYGLLVMLDSNLNFVADQGNGGECQAGIQNHVGMQCWNGQGIFAPCFGSGGSLTTINVQGTQYVAYANWLNFTTGNWVNVCLTGKGGAYFKNSLATGFVTNQPESKYLGLNQNLKSKRYQQLQYSLNVTSDEWILNCQSIPYIPAFVNQTDSQILGAIANALMPGVSGSSAPFFDTTSFMASGTLIPYYQYDPTQTWSDIAKTFADESRYWYKVIDKKIFYQPFGAVPLGIAYDEDNQVEAQLKPDALTTSVVNVPPVNDCTVIGDIEPQTNVDNYFVGDGFTSNFQLKHQVFQGVSSQLLTDDWTESSFQTGSWIVNDPEGAFQLADSGGNAAGALNIIQKGTAATYLPIQNATYIQAQNGLEMGGGINLQHGQCTFNDTAANGGGLIGGIFEELTEFDPGHCLSAFKIQSQPNLGAYVVSVVTASGSQRIELQINSLNVLLQPGNVGKCTGFSTATWLNNQNFYIISIQNNDGNFVITCGAQNPGVIPPNYGPTADSGTITFSADSTIVTASGAAGIYIYPLYNGAVSGTPVVTQPNHQYVLQTWIGAEAPNRFTRPYTNLTQTATFGAQNLSASGTITWVITDVDLGDYVVEEQDPLFGLFPAAPPPVVTKFSISHVEFPPFGIYVLASGINLNLSLNYTVLSLPPQGYLTAQSLTGTSGGNLPVLPSQLTPKIPYQLGFGMINQTAQISQQGEAFALSFYTDDIPSVGARIRFQSWAAGQSIARVHDPAAIAAEGKVEGDSGIRSAIMTNLSPIPRTSAECEAAAAAAILDREFPQFQGSYTVDTQPWDFQTLFNPSMYDYPHTGSFFFINAPVRGCSGQNFFVNTVRIQVVELRQEKLVIGVDYGPDLYLEKQLPSFLEREQNILTPTQTVPPPNPITIPEVLNASLPTLDAAQAITITNTLNGNFIVVDLSGGVELNAASASGVLAAIGATGCEVRYVDNGWGIPNAGRVGVFTVDQFVLPRTVRDQSFFLRGLNGAIFSRFSKELRIVSPLIPSAPALRSADPTTVVFDLSGDVRDIYGLEVRVPSVSGVSFIQLAPGVPVDSVSEFQRTTVLGTSADQGNAFAHYGAVGTNGAPWAPHTVYPPGSIVSAVVGGNSYLFQAQNVLPKIAQQDGTPIPNTQTGDYVNAYFFGAGNQTQFEPYGAPASSAAFHTKLNSIVFNAGNPGSALRSTLTSFVLNQAGEVTSYAVPWGSAGTAYSLVLLHTLDVPAAGTYDMVLYNDDGFFYGIDGGATQTSGPNNNVPPTTSMNGYPALGGNNGPTSTDFGVVYQVHFPAAGRYNVEINFFKTTNPGQILSIFWALTSVFPNGGPAIPVPSNSFPMSMANPPVWNGTLNSVVYENVPQNSSGPFGVVPFPFGYCLSWKNIGPTVTPTPPPFQYQAGDIIYQTCPQSSDFTEVALITAAGTNPDYYYAWFDSGQPIHIVGNLQPGNVAGNAQLVKRTTSNWATASGSMDNTGLATITTLTNHSLNAGDFAIISCGYTTWPGGLYGSQPKYTGAVFCGIYHVLSVPAANSFQIQIPNTSSTYPNGIALVGLVGLVAPFPENPAASGGIILQRVVTAPSDLVVDLTQPDIAATLDLLQSVIPGGRISGLEGLFFNLTWDYSEPTVVPSFTVPSITGIIIDNDTQQVLWNVAQGAGTPDGYRVEITDQNTGLFRNRYTIDHISNKQLLTQLQLTTADYTNPITIKVTPFDTLGDGIPATINWQGTGGGSGGGGTGGIQAIVVQDPLTMDQTLPGILVLGVHDFVGDDGIVGGMNGTVPAPPLGSASGNFVLTASGNWQPISALVSSAINFNQVGVPATTRGDFALPHGLGVVPNMVVVCMTAAGLIRFQNSPSPPWDDTNVYLTASADGLTALLVILTAATLGGGS